MFAAGAGQSENRPGTLQGVLVEKFNGAERDRGVGARDLANVSQVKKVLTNLLLGQPIGRLMVMMVQ